MYRTAAPAKPTTPQKEAGSILGKDAWKKKAGPFCPNVPLCPSKSAAGMLASVSPGGPRLARPRSAIPGHLRSEGDRHGPYIRAGPTPPRPHTRAGAEGADAGHRPSGLRQPRHPDPHVTRSHGPWGYAVEQAQPQDSSEASSGNLSLSLVTLRPARDPAVMLSSQTMV